MLCQDIGKFGIRSSEFKVQVEILRISLIQCNYSVHPWLTCGEVSEGQSPSDVQSVPGGVYAGTECNSALQNSYLADLPHSSRAFTKARPARAHPLDASPALPALAPWAVAPVRSRKSTGFQENLSKG